MFYTAEANVGGKTISIETGRMARQANGAVLVRCGGTIVISTATCGSQPISEPGFFPLTVDYREKSYAAGKIPGGYFKREGRPTDKETLTSRLIDRPIRPLFPKEYKASTHLVSLVLSHDQQHEPDLLAVLGSSCALMISDIPFLGPVSPVRVGRLNGEFIINPTCAQLAACDLSLTVVCSETSIVMVEGGSLGLPEKIITEALRFAFTQAQTLNKLQMDLVQNVGKKKQEIEPHSVEWKNIDRQPIDPVPVFESYRHRVSEALRTKDKMQVVRGLKTLQDELETAFYLDEPGMKYSFYEQFASLEKDVARHIILDERRRNDGRLLDEIRPITCDVDVLPCTHGSAIFTRGQTQALVTLTLGTALDEQKIDDLEGESTKSFMLHYNFPPFCVGETGFLRGPGRREVGHGALAERSILPIIPREEDFPYTIRIVSDIMESNGSSSMATVCGATLALMEGGVPIREPVAGIAMGLILEGDRYAVLSDISGLEDHLGDMDFKVAGTKDGITAIQMDIKLTGFRFEILEEALEQARRGRLHILETITHAISEPRDTLKPNAPRIFIMKINPEKIAAVIGPGGKIIRALTAETGAKIELEDDGTVKLYSSDKASLEMAIKRVVALTEEASIGKDYMGTVRRIEPYGAFIEIIPGLDGLLHVSRMANYRVQEVKDEMKIGDKVLVRVVEIDRMGKVKLSRQELMDEGKVTGLAPKQPQTNKPSESRHHRASTRPPHDRPSSDKKFGHRRPQRNRDHEE